MLISSVRAACLWGLSASFFALAGSLYILISVALTPKQLQPLGRWVCSATLWLAGQRLDVTGEFPPPGEGRTCMCLTIRHCLIPLLWSP